MLRLLACCEAETRPMRIGPGETFVGSILGGKPHGHGKLRRVLTRLSDGTRVEDTFEGTWRRGELCGQATARYASGDVYVGSWRNGRRDGHGRMRLANGDVYIGQWRAGVRQGPGCLMRADGSVVEGRWRGGELERRGQ